jgi:hypothetical protein
MDPHTPCDPDHLNALERRLAAWRPAAEGLDPNAVLFAAGLAAGRSGRGRLLAPALCGLLAALAVGMGVWGMTERAERLALAAGLSKQPPTPQAVPPNAVAGLPELTYTPSSDDYIHLRRRAEQDPNRWLAALSPAGGQAPAPPPGPAILHAGQREGLLNQ